MNTRPVILVGAGGHAKVLLDILIQTGIEVIGLTDLDALRIGQKVHGVTILGGDDAVRRHDADQILLVNGIGSIGAMTARKAVFDRFTIEGYDFVSVVHPAAVVSATAQIEAGVQIMAGCVVQVDARVGRNSIINTGAIVEHDCQIGAHVHLAPGVTLSGDVVIGEETHIGSGATIVQGVRVGRQCTVGAGSVVLEDVHDGLRVAGIPAKVLGR